MFRSGRLVAVSARCGAGVPSWQAERFEGPEAAPTRSMVTAAVATERESRPIEAGFDELDMYSVSLAELSAGICRARGIRCAA